MEQLIQLIQDKLKIDLPELNYIDQDWGQMDFFPNPPVKFPCALIDIQSAEYTNKGDYTQHGTATVVIRIFDIKLSNSSNGAPQNQKDNAKKIWKLIEAVNKSLHGRNFLPDNFGLPIRVQLRRTKRNDGCYQNELYYTIQFVDESTKPEYEKAIAEPKVFVTVKQM